jgi:hypothetical protein
VSWRLAAREGDPLAASDPPADVMTAGSKGRSRFLAWPLLAPQLGASAFVAGMLFLLASPLLTGWLSARPQLVDYAAVPLLAILIRRIAAGPNPVRPVMAAGIVSVVWVNLHAGELIGVAMICACAVLLLARREIRAAGAWPRVR